VSRENDQIDEKYGFARIPRKELVIWSICIWYVGWFGVFKVITIDFFNSRPKSWMKTED
jgi:hypothetical protein